MKNVSKYLWLVFGLVLVGAGCSGADDSGLTIDEEGSVSVVEVTVEGDTATIEEVDEGIEPAREDAGEEVADALKADEDPIGGDPVIDANFTMQAGNFFFEPSSMRVNAGDTVNLFFTENAGTHTFVIDEIGFKQNVVEGGSMTFTAPTEPGSYAYYCDIGSHRALGMEGVLIVE